MGGSPYKDAQGMPFVAVPSCIFLALAWCLCRPTICVSRALSTIIRAF